MSTGNIYRRFGGRCCLRLQGNSLKRRVLLTRRHMPQDLKFQYRCENIKFSNVLIYLQRYWPHPRNLLCSGSMLWVTNFLAHPQREAQQRLTHFPNSAQLSAFLSEISAANFHAVLQTTTGNFKNYWQMCIPQRQCTQWLLYSMSSITVSVLSTNMKAKYS